MSKKVKFLKHFFIDKVNNFLVKSLFKSLIKKINNKEEISQLNKLVKENRTASGYVPYVHGKTEITIYNFFSINYSIKIDSYLIVSFLDYELNCNFSIFKKIKNREIINISIDELNEFSEHISNSEYCLVLLLNKKISISHGGWFGGHFRFWAVNDNFSSFVHSMPIAYLGNLKFRSILNSLNLKTKSILAERRIYPQNAKNVKHYGFGMPPKVVIDRGDLSESLNTPIGFSLIYQEKINAIYHDSVLDRHGRHNKIFENINHVIAIPPFYECDIEMYFGEVCSNLSKFKITVWRKNILTSEIDNFFEEKITIDINKPLLLSDLFKIKDVKNYIYWACFKPLEGLHDDHFINLIYKRENKIFDCVHSHSFYENKKDFPRRSRALKFAPYKLGKNNYPLLALWTGKDHQVHARIRIFNSEDSNFERIFTITLPKNEVFYIDLRNFMDEEFIYSQNKNLFLAQVECDELNINGSMFNIRLNNETIDEIGIDHLTGG